MSVNGYLLHAGMVGRGYRPEVIQALLPFGDKQLGEMDAWDDQTFGTRIGSNASPEFNAADKSLKTLGRTNVTFATAMAERYKKDPAGYRQMTDNLAKTMEKDPAFAKKIGEMAQSNDPKKLITLTDNYQNDPGATYKALMNPPKAPAAPASTTVTTAAPAKPTTPTAAPKENGKSKNKKKPHETTPPQEKSAPVTTVVAAPATEESAAAAPITGPLSAAQAKERFQTMLKDPNNELSALIHLNDLEGDVLKQLDKNPNLVKNFGLPANESEYVGLLKDGKRSEFLSAFAGPDPKNSMGTGLDNIMNGFGDIGKMMGDLFGNLFGKGTGGAGGLGGMFDQFKNLMGRMFGGGEGARDAALLGGGTTLPAMLRHPGNKAINTEYIEDQTNLAVKNLQSNDPQVRKHAQDYLKQVGITDRGTLHELQQEQVRISHIGIDTVTEKDSAGNITLRRAPVGYVKRYESAEEMCAALYKPDADTAVQNKNPDANAAVPAETRTQYGPGLEKGRSESGANAEMSPFKLPPPVKVESL